MSIFTERKNFKPFEYPVCTTYIDAINRSFWVHNELNFMSDVQDFKVKLNDSERKAIHKTLLAISQIEVKVKSFWSLLFKHIPKPEVNAVGATFAESEVRHERAYSHLLEVLGLNDDFNELLEVPEISRRVDYLNKYIEQDYKDEKRQFALSLTLFTLFVENVSLFSQFALIMSFNRLKGGTLKDISNVVEWTSKEELLHGQFGTFLVNEIKKEHPEWFNSAFYAKVNSAAKKAVIAEDAIIDWIFSEGEIDIISKETLKNFVRQRINVSLVGIGGQPLFDESEEENAKISWFNEEIYSTAMTDFFFKRPTSYAKKTQAVTKDNLF